MAHRRGGSREESAIDGTTAHRSTVRQRLGLRSWIMRAKLPALLSLFSVLVAACAASSGGEPKSPTVTECGEHAKPARDKVDEAIAANLACSSDDDCQILHIHTACFDACVRAVAKSGREAIEQAMSSASDAECKAFAASGCKLIAPPCAPPEPPACRDGKCI